MDEFVFDDLAPREKPVTLGGKRYLLREASEDAARQYRNASARAARMTDGKVTGLDGVADVQHILVGMCLYELTKEGQFYTDRAKNPKPVGKEFVLTLLSRHVKPMFEWIKENSDLKEEDSWETVNKEQELLDKRKESLKERERAKNSLTAPRVNGEPETGTTCSSTAENSEEICTT